MDTNRLLKAIWAELLEEIKSNASLRKRIDLIIEQRVGAKQEKKGRPHRRAPGPFDPMQAYHEAPGDLEPRLHQLEVEQLKDIIAEHGMDRTKLAMKWKLPDRLIDLIMTTVKARCQKGDAFRSDPTA